MCNDCSGQVDSDMYCTNCGDEIADSSRFCTACGTQLAPETSSGSTATGQTVIGNDPGRTATAVDSQAVVGGLDRNVAGLLTYLFGFITGLLFFLLEERDEFVRFHAAQSMVVFGGLVVIGIAVNLFGGILAAINGIVFGLFGLFFSLAWLLVSLVSVILWIYLMVSAYQGKTPRIPVAANIADDLV